MTIVGNGYTAMPLTAANILGALLQYTSLPLPGVPDRSAVSRDIKAYRQSLSQIGRSLKLSVSRYGQALPGQGAVLHLTNATVQWTTERRRSKKGNAYVVNLYKFEASGSPAHHNAGVHTGTYDEGV